MKLKLNCDRPKPGVTKLLGCFLEETKWYKRRGEAKLINTPRFITQMSHSQVSTNQLPITVRCILHRVKVRSLVKYLNEKMNVVIWRTIQSIRYVHTHCVVEYLNPHTWTSWVTSSCRWLSTSKASRCRQARQEKCKI